MTEKRAEEKSTVRKEGMKDARRGVEKDGGGWRDRGKRMNERHGT